MRENAATKAKRLLSEGRLTVLRVDDDGISAAVHGDSGELHHVTYTGGRWSCDCPAMGPCSHARAAALVTVVPTASRWADLIDGGNR